MESRSWYEQEKEMQRIAKLPDALPMREYTEQNRHERRAEEAKARRAKKLRAKVPA